jgi:hypothetical protein
MSTDLGAGFHSRLDVAEERLRRLAERESAGLTDPDEPGGERWDSGQVWSHLAEFIPFWVAQAERLVHSTATEPPPFGRTKTSPDRIAAIERGRHLPRDQLLQAVLEDISDLRFFIDDLSLSSWEIRGRHERLGVMSMQRIVEEFLVGHIEEHAAQLEALDGS